MEKDGLPKTDGQYYVTMSNGQSHLLKDYIEFSKGKWLLCFSEADLGYNVIRYLEPLPTHTEQQATEREGKMFSVEEKKVCADCGSDKDIRKWESGANYQCHKCYKDDKYFEDEYR